MNLNIIMHVAEFFFSSEMWCLGRYLPLLISDLVPDDWQNFLRLMGIVDCIFALVTHSDSFGSSDPALSH